MGNRLLIFKKISDKNSGFKVRKKSVRVATLFNKAQNPTIRQILHKTAVVLKSSVHEKGIEGHCPRYFRANSMLKVEVKIGRATSLVGI